METGFPKYTQTTLLGFLTALVAGGVTMGGCGRSGLRIDGCILPKRCSGTLLCQCLLLRAQLCFRALGNCSNVAAAWDWEKVMAPGCESWLALCPP